MKIVETITPSEWIDKYTDLNVLLTEMETVIERAEKDQWTNEEGKCVFELVFLSDERQDSLLEKTCFTKFELKAQLTQEEKQIVAKQRENEEFDFDYSVFFHHQKQVIHHAIETFKKQIIEELNACVPEVEFDFMYAKTPHGSTYYGLYVVVLEPCIPEKEERLLAETTEYILEINKGSYLAFDEGINCIEPPCYFTTSHYLSAKRFTDKKEAQKWVDYFDEYQRKEEMNDVEFHLDEKLGVPHRVLTLRSTLSYE